jgi:hypothetical protein
MDRIRVKTSIPVIAGGLITERKEIEEIVSSGAIGVSTSSAQLWGKTQPFNPNPSQSIKGSHRFKERS